MTLCTKKKLFPTLLLYKNLLYPIVLAVIILAVYSISINYPFFKSFDDSRYITENPYLKLSVLNIITVFTKPYFRMYIPVTMLSYMFDYNVWGSNSFGYHLQNIFWHIVASIAIFECFRFFKVRSWLAFLLCLIFAIHPQRVESVVWLSERKDVLCTAFYFISILFFLTYTANNKRKNYFSSFAFYLVALLSKPMAVSLPFILLFILFSKKKSWNFKYYLTQLWPFFITLLIFFPLTYFNQAVAHGRFNLYKQVFLIFYNLKFYFISSLFPVHVVPVYPITPINYNTIFTTILFYTVIILISIYVFIKYRNSFLYIILPLYMAYITVLAPIIGIVPFGFFEQADRWSYIPSVFIWFSIGLIIERLLLQKSKSTGKQLFLRSKKLIFIILLFYAATSAAMNCIYQKNWKDQYTLFLYASKYPSPNPLVLCVLCNISISKRDYKQVLYFAKKIAKKSPLFASFYIANAMYQTDSKEAVNSLIKLKPFFKNLANNNMDTFNFYIRTLLLLVDYYSKPETKNEAMKYINEILCYQKINQLNEYKLKVLKTELQEKYMKAFNTKNTPLAIEFKHKLH